MEFKKLHEPWVIYSRSNKEGIRKYKPTQISAIYENSSKDHKCESQWCTDSYWKKEKSELINWN